ncbi:oligosaccharide flippase family protein [Sphingomonas sp. BK580]|uniref:oligosaccharide flippase family protein n=1 Tax=Sphingomonas sp. BK580 TaxID=2586972 RepID=UPI00161EC484|nr:oligosaccharide flippase family protein [Sphingomonas sp. BK580]MBB3693783.1 O-antigen/teichoic acid export membrane protein [Sphingomonas sp. BK580]
MRRYSVPRLAQLLRSTVRNKFFLWNMFGNIAPLIFAIAAVPFIYSHTTKAYVGFLTMTWAAIGYTGLFDFGLGRALSYFAAISRSNPKVDVAGALKKSIGFALCISFVIDIILYLGWSQIAGLSILRNLDRGLALMIIAGTLPIFLISNMMRSCLEGFEQFRQASIFKFISYTSLFLCPVLLISIEIQNLSTVCLSYALIRLGATAYAAYSLVPSLRALRGNRASVTPVRLRQILGFGGWATLSSTISPLMVYGDRFALAYFNGAASMAIYALLQEFIGKTILFSASYVTSVQPRLGYLPQAEAMALYRREHKIVMAFSVIIYGSCLVGSPVFASAWLHVPIRDVAALSAIMSVGFLFNSMAQAPLTYLLARGEPKRIAYSHVLEAFIYFPLLIGGAMSYGVVGAAIAGVLRQIFDYGILSWQARRTIG